MISSRTLAKTFVELSKKTDSEKGINKLLNYIFKKNLVGLLPQVVNHIKTLEPVHSEYNTLHVYTRFPLGLSELAEVKKITKSGDIQAKQHIDESVIGGFSAEYKGNLYDGTLGNQVTRLRSMLLR